MFLPQMSPMWWTTMMMIFIIVMMMSMQLMYFNFNKIINMKKTTFKKKFNWKW